MDRNIGWALRAALYSHDEIHTEATAPAAPAADPWLHIFYYELLLCCEEYM